MIQKPYISIHKKLVEDIKKQIDEGKLKKDDLLPSENDLSALYKTSRTTVRLALVELSNAGYIHRHQGKGSIVSGNRRGIGILSVSGLTAGVGARHLKTMMLKKPAKQPWPTSFFYKLNDIELSAGCIFFSRLRYIDDVPVIFEETYITDLNLPRFTSLNLENRSFLKVLNEHYKVEVVGGEQKIWAISAGKTYGNLLKLKPTTPLVHMKRKLRTNADDLNIYSWLYCNTENYYLDDYF